jgi:5'-nucleotidase
MSVQPLTDVEDVLDLLKADGYNSGIISGRGKNRDQDEGRKLFPDRTEAVIMNDTSDTPLILLTNDDGFFSEGLAALEREMKTLGEVYIVAPDRERSATSLSITLHSPLRVKKIRDRVFAVDGTPTDCVYMAVRMLCPRKPALLISGINPGPNLGQQDIAYSGTVAGALQGTFLKIPSMAVSIMHGHQEEADFGEAARLAGRIARSLLSDPLPEGITLNVNVPPPPVKGIRLVKLGEKRYNPEITSRTDPRGRIYYWIGTGTPKAVGDGDSDVQTIKDGYATVTPLHRDLTHYSALKNHRLGSIFERIGHDDR